MHKLRFSLMAFWVLNNALAAETGHAAAAPPWPREITGYGLTVQEAKNDAYKHIAEKMTWFLARQSPPMISWKPDVLYVRRHVLDGAGAPGEDDVLESVRTKSWIFPIKPLDLAALKVLDGDAERAARRAERIRLALPFYGGAALLLALVAAGWRLRNASVPFWRRVH